MKASEIRDLSVVELNEKLVELKKELFNLRFQSAINQLENPMRIKADGTVDYRKVELGRRMDAEWEVISGLEDGQTVVVKGQNALTNGCKVNVMNK